MHGFYVFQQRWDGFVACGTECRNQVVGQVGKVILQTVPQRGKLLRLVQL